VRVARGLLRVLAGLAVVVALLLAAAIVALRTDAGRAWVLGLALDRLRGAVNGTVEVGRLRGDLLSEVVLEDVVVSGREGDAFLAVDRLAVEYELGALLRREVLLGDAELVRPRVRLVRAADGTWNATRIPPSSAAAKSPAPRGAGAPSSAWATCG
jgi:AsmA protein